jgi:hypothetical protein
VKDATAIQNARRDARADTVRRGDRIEGILFALAWLFIGATSTFDAYLAMHFSQALEEENPIGRFLIALASQPGGPQDVSLLIGVKMFGTILVLGTLVLLYQRSRPAARVVIAALTLSQFFLMLYVLS